MEPVALVVDKIKGFAKSSQIFVDGIFHRSENSARRNPIEILKRLQREAFSDLMKLRDRQDKVERVLSFYKTSNGGPFQEGSTHVRGEVDVLGALLMMGDVDQQHYDTVGRAGINTGVRSKLTFETAIRQKDTLLAEFLASQKAIGYGGDVSESALTLAKVSYTANISDWFSAIAIPVGAQFRDLHMTTNSCKQRHGLTDLSSIGPSVLNQHNDAAIGVTVRKSNVIASVAQSVTGLGRQPFSDGIGHCFSTFGQIVCQLPRGMKFSLIGLQQIPKSSSHHINLGSLAIPIGLFKRHEPPVTSFEGSALTMGTSTRETISTGSIALKLESELDENTRIGGWIEMQNSNPKHLRWAINAFDDSVDEFGWGLNVSGIAEGHLQAESYVKLNLGKKFSLKPGITCTMDGNAKIFALMLRSNWSF